MSYRIVTGDLFNANVDFIVQQTCCTAMIPKGLSKAVSDKYPHINPYSCRKRFKYNWATQETRSDPGSIEYFPTPDSTFKGVICLYAQYTHGKPGVYKDPLNIDVPDTSLDRLEYLEKCLEELYIKHTPKSVGIPFKMGCGLAGGHWPTYENIIRKWSDKYSVDVTVFRI